MAAALAIFYARGRDARCEIRNAVERWEVGNERFKMGDGRSGLRDRRWETNDEGWEMGQNETQDSWNGQINDKCEMKDKG